MVFFVWYRSLDNGLESRHLASVQWPRTRALPVADTARVQSVPRSAIRKPASPGAADAGHRKRTPHIPTLAVDAQNRRIGGKTITDSKAGT